MSKHNHLNYFECECNRYLNDPYADDDEIINDLHQDHMRMISEVRDLLQSLEAEQKLKDGFRGMGHNILTESSGRKRMHMRRLKEMIGE